MARSAVLNFQVDSRPVAQGAAMSHTPTPIGETERKLAAYDQMLAALQYAYDRYGIKDVEAWERIKAAIDAATGETK